MFPKHHGLTGKQVCFLSSHRIRPSVETMAETGDGSRKEPANGSSNSLKKSGKSLGTAPLDSFCILPFFKLPYLGCVTVITACRWPFLLRVTVITACRWPFLRRVTVITACKWPFKPLMTGTQRTFGQMCHVTTGTQRTFGQMCHVPRPPSPVPGSTDLFCSATTILEP